MARRTRFVLAGFLAMLAVLGSSLPAQAQQDALSDELRTWLDDRGSFRVGWSSALRPVSIVEDGVVTGGYAVDAWDLAALRLGLDLEHVAYPDAPSLGAALTAGEIDVVGALGSHPAVAEGRQASEPYAWVPAVFVGLPAQAAFSVDDLSGRTLTSLPGAAILDQVMEAHPGGTYVPTDGPVVGLQAVAAGEIDLYFGPLALLGHQITRLDLDLVPIGEREGLSTVQSWAEVSSEAAAVADAVRGSLSSSDLALLHIRWTGFDLTDPDARGLPGWVLPTAAALTALVIVLSLFALLLRRRVAAATQELRTVNEGLEASVAARTRDLRESNKALRRFASTAAHDLRGPVTAIAGLASMLEEGIVVEPDRQTELHRVIHSSASRLGTMINGMLEDAGRVGVGAGSLEGATLVAWLHEVAGPELTVIGAELRVEAPDGPLHLDAEVLRRSVLNLVGNAIKYATNEVQTQIEVDLRRRDDQWSVVVRDNGPGIPEALWGEVFEQGARLVSDDRGYGLGLAEIRALVQQAGGGIRIGTSALGGAEFTVTLPVLEQATEVTDDLDAEAQPAG